MRTLLLCLIVLLCGCSKPALYQRGDFRIFPSIYYKDAKRCICYELRLEDTLVYENDDFEKVREKADYFYEVSQEKEFSLAKKR